LKGGEPAQGRVYVYLSPKGENYRKRKKGKKLTAKVQAQKRRLYQGKLKKSSSVISEVLTEAHPQNGWSKAKK